MPEAMEVSDAHQPPSVAVQMRQLRGSSNSPTLAHNQAARPLLMRLNRTVRAMLQPTQLVRNGVEEGSEAT
jgi:hypothetical protein